MPPLQKMARILNTFSTIFLGKRDLLSLIQHCNVVIEQRRKEVRVSLIYFSSYYSNSATSARTQRHQ